MYDKEEKVRGLRKQKDEFFGSVCRFFDLKERRCTVYEARPADLPRLPLQQDLRLLRVPQVRAYLCRTTRSSSP